MELLSNPSFIIKIDLVKSTSLLLNGGRTITTKLTNHRHKAHLT